MQLIKELEKRKRFLERVITQLEYNLQKYPEGTIQCHKDYDNSSIIRFFLNKSGKKSYLSEKKDKLLIKALLQKRYDINSYKTYTKELKLINRLIEFETARIYELDNDLFNEMIYKYIRRLEISIIDIIEDFNKNIHGSSSSRTGQYRVTTKEGVLVKSKAEQIIADELYDSGIPFRYELSLKCADQSFRSPDFTIINPATGKLFYWEHFGMIDRPEYARDMVDKINSYSLSQIIPGDNLILTIADDRRLNVRDFTNQVRRIIERVLR